MYLKCNNLDVYVKILFNVDIGFLVQLSYKFLEEKRDFNVKNYKFLFKTRKGRFSKFIFMCGFDIV